MVRVREYRASVATRRLWRVAVLTAAGAIGAASQAEAALYYWSDSDPGLSQAVPFVAQRRQKVRHRQGKKIEAPQKEAGKPQGPLIIAISIQKQRLKVYDAAGFYAETPISTGMRGHPTPMGVFSVIQKQKLHHSNIYSNAPMPYMQRITWSGVAMHAGVLPGYPASHGCIRMPMAFAVKMWNWTRMGARVVVTPGETTPADFSHPLLVAQKVVPQPSADAPSPDAPAAAKPDKASDASDANVAVKPAISEASLEPRPTVGHGADDRTRTADASSALPTTNAPVTMTDATSAVGTPTVTTATVPVNAGDASNVDTKSESANSETLNPKPGETASSDGKSVETKSSEAVGAEGTKANDVKAEGLKADAPKVLEKANEAPGEPIKAVTDAHPAAADVKKDQGRMDIEKATMSKPAPAVGAAPKRSGPISVFVSRKDSKLYVRQNFAPLFEAPVTIAPSDRPLGTHVFTAQVDKNDANILHWSVVSLPVPTRYAERRDDDERAWRRHRSAGAAEIKPVPVPDSPAEALDRLTVPANAMARITEALSTGGSIIVSDQGIAAGETGEGTDFIVSLR
jgi:lipoprotein-anchoring transpeptidase ErfK/SrfK